ncbi:hypothetical protein ASF40_09200 [Microbacterium sp. Leaf288]|nr:hypothetical protein ASF40_09200 [Microbacterium sp. Leaf288]
MVIDTFLDDHVARTPTRDDLPAMDALREHLSSVATLYAGHEGDLMAQLIAECQYDPETMAEFKRRFYDQRLETAVGLIERAVAEGGVRTDVAPVTIAQMLYAPLYFRLLFRESGLDADGAVDILSTALAGIRARDAS